MNYDYFVKVILVGDAGVGKTSLATSMAGEQPVVDYIPTIGMDFKVVRQKAKRRIPGENAFVGFGGGEGLSWYPRNILC